MPGMRMHLLLVWIFLGSDVSVVMDLMREEKAARQI